MKKPTKCELCNAADSTEVCGKLGRREDGTLGLLLMKVCEYCSRRQQDHSERQKLR